MACQEVHILLVCRGIAPPHPAGSTVSACWLAELQLGVGGCVEGMVGELDIDLSDAVKTFAASTSMGLVNGLIGRPACRDIMLAREATCKRSSTLS